MALPYDASIDPSYPLFAGELKALAKSHPHLFSHFTGCWTELSQASLQIIESAFDGSYDIYKLSYQNGRLEVLARLQNGVMAFTTIIKPKLSLTE